MQCHIKTYCQGIHCQCCEELRCFSHQESLSLESETPNNGILVVQNCTDAFTPNLHQTYCQGLTWCDRVIFTSQFFSAQDVSKLFNLIYKKNYNPCKESKSYYNFIDHISVKNLGSCFKQDVEAIKRFLNSSCVDEGIQICQRRIHHCQDLICRCCDHYHCVLNEPKYPPFGYQDLHPEDKSLQLLSMVSWAKIQKKSQIK